MPLIDDPPDCDPAPLWLTDKVPPPASAILPRTSVVAFATVTADAVELFVRRVPVVKLAAPPPASIAIVPAPASMDFAAASVTPPVPLASAIAPPPVVMLSFTAIEPVPAPVSDTAPTPVLLMPPLPATRVIERFALSVRLLADA